MMSPVPNGCLPPLAIPPQPPFPSGTPNFLVFLFGKLSPCRGIITWKRAIHQSPPAGQISPRAPRCGCVLQTHAANSLPNRTRVPPPMLAFAGRGPCPSAHPQPVTVLPHIHPSRPHPSGQHLPVALLISLRSCHPLACAPRSSQCVFFKKGRENTIAAIVSLSCFKSFSGSPRLLG